MGIYQDAATHWRNDDEQQKYEIRIADDIFNKIFDNLPSDVDGVSIGYYLWSSLIYQLVGAGWDQKFLVNETKDYIKLAEELFEKSDNEEDDENEDEENDNDDE